jgi:hypothetical protein
MNLEINEFIAKASEASEFSHLFTTERLVEMGTQFYMDFLAEDTFDKQCTSILEALEPREEMILILPKAMGVEHSVYLFHFQRDTKELRSYNCETEENNFYELDQLTQPFGAWEWSSYVLLSEFEILFTGYNAKKESAIWYNV